MSDDLLGSDHVAATSAPRLATGRVRIDPRLWTRAPRHVGLEVNPYGPGAPGRLEDFLAALGELPPSGADWCRRGGCSLTGGLGCAVLGRGRILLGGERP